MKREPAYDYARHDSYRQRHHERYKRFVESMSPRLVCQDCKGSGEEVIDQIDYTVITEPCVWCEGTGFVTRHKRGMWLKIQREIKRSRHD